MIIINDKSLAVIRFGKEDVAQMLRQPNRNFINFLGYKLCTHSGQLHPCEIIVTLEIDGVPFWDEGKTHFTTSGLIEKLETIVAQNTRSKLLTNQPLRVGNKTLSVTSGLASVEHVFTFYW